jgi:predicted TIM-barrel fold metal-dependent hydrolase
MPAIIDGDAHVIECERTWARLDPAFGRYTPRAVRSDTDGRMYWHIDGQIFSRASGDEHLPLAIRDVSDVKGRLKMMDDLHVDIQVLFPTFFLQGLPTKWPEVNASIVMSYNRWLADAFAESNGRLRWALIPPLDSPEHALRELEFGREHGACGVFLRGIEGNRLLTNPYFDPLYQRAMELDLPICIHAGNGNNAIKDVLFTQDLFFFGVTPVLAAFNAIVTSALPERFPRLRFGFIEIGSQWVPYLVREAARRHEFIHTAGAIEDEWTAMKTKRLFVSCRTDDDLPYVLKWAGEDNLFIGTDFGHEDPAAEMDALQTLRRREDVSASAIDNILGPNARAFYAV